MEILMKDGHIPPETFDSATVAFTSISHFSHLVYTLTPLNIMNLLTAFFVCMDEMIAFYDVYKVETVKDSYMVRFSALMASVASPSALKRCGSATNHDPCTVT